MIRTLIFDWGDTVMRVFPEYAGPMADWPEVAAVPGITTALGVLQSRYLLVLTTNAADSGAALARAALHRARLDRFFHVLLTARELGTRKPDPDFFRAALHEIECTPEEAIAIGDDYQADVICAKAAGLRAIWFNPTASFCPQPHPRYDAELLKMAELPRVLDTMHLPDEAECLALLAEQGTSPDIISHCQAVAAAAFRLAERLRAAGEDVDPLLAHRGGLLHDVARRAAREAEQPHDELAGAILRSHGWEDLATIAERHTVYAMTDPARKPVTWEQRLVYYADRLLEEGKLLGVEQRMAAMRARHPELSTDFDRYLAAALELQTEIVERLHTTPAELMKWLRGQLA